MQPCYADICVQLSGVHVLTHTTQDISEDPKRQSPVLIQPTGDVNWSKYGDSDKPHWVDQDADTDKPLAK